MKLFFARPRPQLPWASVLPDYSFPSGHTMNAVVFYVGAGPDRCGRSSAGGSGWPRPGRRRHRRSAVGVSRIYLGYHYLTDVVGGILAGHRLAARRRGRVPGSSDVAAAGALRRRHVRVPRDRARSAGRMTPRPGRRPAAEGSPDRAAVVRQVRGAPRAGRLDGRERASSPRRRRSQQAAAQGGQGRAATSSSPSAVTARCVRVASGLAGDGRGARDRPRRDGQPARGQPRDPARSRAGRPRCSWPAASGGSTSGRLTIDGNDAATSRWPAASASTPR